MHGMPLPCGSPTRLPHTLLLLQEAELVALGGNEARQLLLLLTSGASAKAAR
jgi:hypothetical protein